MRFAKWPALMLSVVGVLGCDRPVAPLLVDGAVRFEPPPAYQLWWQMAQECSGRRGVLSHVDWYYVPGARTLVVEGQRVEGYWTSAGNTIVVAEASMFSGPLVRHEMLHSLVRGDGHPRDFFLERCGGVVWCYGPCIEDGGPPPPPTPTAIRVEPDALEIAVEVRPAAPSQGLYGGHFALTVTARNPLPHPAVVRLPPTTFGEPGTGFEYRFDNAVGADGGIAPVWDEGVTRFAAGETKRQVFDFNIYTPGSSSGGLAPGTYTFFGAFGGRVGARPATVIVP